MKAYSITLRFIVTERQLKNFVKAQLPINKKNLIEHQFFDATERAMESEGFDGAIVLERKLTLEKGI